jgi:phosphoserine phosphatase RsbU/P
MIVMLTDGFEEAVNPDDEMLGTERVLEVVKKNRELPAGEIIQALQEEVRNFSGGRPQLDDLTAILVKVK